MLGEQKHVPLRRREGIEPAATLVDDDDDVGVAAILDRTAGTFLEIDLPAVFLQQGCAANVFAQLFDFSLVHCLHRRRAGDNRPLLLLVHLVLTLRHIPDRPRSLPNARARVQAVEFVR
ncbi:hypothetical protein ACVWWO_000289 [Bradyrhizobium sp. F1.13.1]